MSFLPEFTALENVIIPAIIKGEKKNISLKKAKNPLRNIRSIKCH